MACRSRRRDGDVRHVRVVGVYRRMCRGGKVEQEGWYPSLHWHDFHCYKCAASSTG